MQKWEYCKLTGIGGGNVPTSYPKFFRFTTRGLELETDFGNRAKGVSEKDAVAQLVAQLGDEGWELTSAGGTGDFHCLYFKRPKP